jgi:phosphopantothenoylcysteine decarboxylase
MNIHNGDNVNIGVRAHQYHPLVAREHAQDGKYHLLLACSGSVATIKLPNMIRALSLQENLSIRVIVTESAAKFLQGQSEEQPHLDEIRNYPNVDAIYRDEDEWKVPWTRGGRACHCTAVCQYARQAG